MTPDEITGGEGAAAEPDLRGELSAAFDAFEAGDTGTAAPGAPAPAAAPAAAPQAPAGETAAQAAQRARDEQGRFAKTGEQGQVPKQKTEPAAPQAGQVAAAAQAQPSVPPATWSATAKAKFAALDPEIQREVLKREGEMDQGRAQWQQGAERLNRLDAILAPRSERFRLAGLDEVGAVNALFAAQDMLERTPVDALLYLGRQAGVNWQMLFQRLRGGQGQPQPQIPPGMEHVVRQVQTLSQAFSQQQAAAQNAARDGALNQIQSFAADPKNIYFENVKVRMGDLIRSGRASDLADAYDQACWSDPTVRPLMISASETQRQAEARAAAGQRTAAARAASGSVTGSPTPGGSGRGGPAPSLRDELSQAWDAVAA